jgi:hypothetical protein
VTLDDRSGGAVRAAPARSTLQRYEELLLAQGRPTAWVADTLWTVYQRMAVTVGPPTLAVTLGNREAKQVLSRLPAVLVRWTDGIDSNPANPWYSVVCDRLLQVKELPSGNTRSKVKRGLARCRVAKADASRIAQEGYDVYAAAFGRYRNGAAPAISRDEFARGIEVDSRFPDIIEYFGVWIDEKLVAYSRNRLFDQICADYDVIKFAPDGLKSYSSYALIQSMNEHYLGERGFRMVNDGLRSLLHDTEFQQFLMHQFGFRAATHRLSVRYRPLIGLTIAALRPFARRAGQWSGNLKALLEQDQISRTCGINAGSASA